MQSTNEGLWNAKVEPEVVYTSAAEWPTLQAAMRAIQTEKEQNKDNNDEWGGKVWDGVTDWFL